MLSNTRLVKCGKCKFTFHDNSENIITCPRCGGQLNPNLVQAGMQRDKALRDLTRILAFGQAGQQEKSGLANVPVGVTSIDRELMSTKQSKPKEGVQQPSNKQQEQKRIRDLESVLREFS